jgi:GxxExxY protein
MGTLLLEKETYAIRGACFEVYKEKGSGFLEPVFQECMEKELEIQQIPFVAQPELSLSYKGHPLKQKYIPDLVIYDKIIVELKAVSQLTEAHRAQVLNYLYATGHKVGLLVNFGHHPKVEIERLAL